jgi:curved DNA-binding protein CbpA
MSTPAPPSYLDALRQIADRIFPSLDGRSYYQLLNVPETADSRTVRAAFFKLAAQLHPDRFHTLPDPVLKERLETIYARIGEAYRVLSNVERRAGYDRTLASGSKRLDTTARESSGPRSPEDTISHPEAKKFFRLGLSCLGAKDWKGAVMNLTFAKNFEAGSAVIGERLAEASEGLAAAKARGNPTAKPGATR